MDREAAVTVKTTGAMNPVGVRGKGVGVAMAVVGVAMAGVGVTTALAENRSLQRERREALQSEDKKIKPRKSNSEERE